MDLVMAEGRLDEFADRAATLGWTALLAVLPNLKAARAAKGTSHPKVAISIGVLCSDKQAAAAKSEGFVAVLKGGGNDRAAIERAKPDVMFGFEEAAHKDGPHQRRSGFNDIMAVIAKKTGTIFGLAFSEIMHAEEKKALIIGRWAQNAMICRKEKVPVLCASFARTPYEMRSPQDIASFFKVIGVTHEQIAEGYAALRAKTL